MAKPIDKEYLKKALKNFDEEILGNKYLQEKDTKVQADWNETDTASEAFIKNKPEIISEERVTALETPTFTQATTRANIASGESTKTILGKIKKYFTDLKTHAFNVPANNLTTTTTGYALDATQGKALQDKLGSTDISEIGDGTVTNAISTINSNLSSNLKYIKTTKCDIPQTIGGIVSNSPYTCLVTGFAVVTIKAWHDQTLPLDGAINLNGEQITSGYFTYKYQTLSATIPVKVGDVLSCTEGFNISLRIIF